VGKPYNEVEEVALLLAKIAPDPVKARRCTVPYCNGRRGWATIACTQKDNKPHYTIEVCCGRVGLSDFALINQNVTKLADNIDKLVESAGQIILVHREMDIHTGEALEQFRKLLRVPAIVRWWRHLRAKK
jgi:hypothetical protein